MTFRHLISETGLDPNDYPVSAKTEVKMLDRKNREITEKLKFTEPLFSKNSESKKKFKEFLEGTEKEPLNKIWIRLQDDGLMICYPSLYNPKKFFRF